MTMTPEQRASRAGQAALTASIREAPGFARYLSTVAAGREVERTPAPTCGSANGAELTRKARDRDGIRAAEQARRDEPAAKRAVEPERDRGFGRYLRGRENGS